CSLSSFFFPIWWFLSKESPFATPRLEENRAKDKFSWETIVPSEKLLWTGCYSENQRARLKVPLDYSRPDGALAAIAMLRIHSGVSHDSPAFRRPILVNPGGPGGSGVDLVAVRGAQLSTVLGPEYDVIGFDPRGIGRSTPRVSFFESRAEREIWSRSSGSNTPSMNSSADALAQASARGMLEGQLADDSSLPFLTTDHTARDMLRIVQAHGLEKIQYWVFRTYRSVLGATFASMFPVGSFENVGVVDSENYFATEWSKNLIDTDKVWMVFIDGCVAAGPEGCAFYAPTSAEISDKVDKIYASLRARPIPVRTNTSFGVVDYSMLRREISQTLYSPYALFPTLAQALADLSAGNGTVVFKMSEQPAFECACDPSDYRFESVQEAGAAVRCNDGKRISPEYEDVLAHYHKLSKLSAWADIWERARMPCFPKNHFQGPFIANTSFSLLVGNTADPVTLLWAAKKMSQSFAGSVVLTQDSPGHCSLSGPSVCTRKYIRQYFLNGTLPEPGTVCPVIASPFPANDLDAAADAQAVLSLSMEDRTVLEAVRELATTSDVRFPAGLNNIHHHVGEDRTVVFRLASELLS
ncbi:TAP-like protein-domain-containing protein, partial [Mycena leptocephala]